MDDDRTVGAASALFVRYLNQPSVRTSPIYIYALMGNWISSLPPVDATMALSISSPRSTSLRVFFSYFPFFFCTGDFTFVGVGLICSLMLIVDDEPGIPK